MGLKGYRLWVMGQIDSTCSALPLAAVKRRTTARRPAALARKYLSVAVQVACEKYLFKPGLRFRV
jgi:hypothetical protein